MFLRAKVRKKDGKPHRYFSVVENRRVGENRTVQRTVLYLGEINDSQESIWRKTLQVFDEGQQQYTTLSLFPEDREIPAAASDSIQVKLSEMQLRRPRAFGNCWLGCALWRQLRLEEFWEEKLAEKVQRETVSWAKVLQLLVVNRLIDPGSEFRVHRQWFDQSAMAELLQSDFAVAEKDRLYRCLDRLLEHKAALFQHLRERWQDLFGAQFDVLLYDLTSTYIEGEGDEIPKAKYGYSRDQRFDCKQVVIALVITPEGFPLAYEVMEGNTADCTTLRGFLEKIENSYGKARRVWVIEFAGLRKQLHLHRFAHLLPGQVQPFLLILSDLAAWRPHQVEDLAVRGAHLMDRGIPTEELLEVPPLGSPSFSILVLKTNDLEKSLVVARCTAMWLPMH